MPLLEIGFWFRFSLALFFVSFFTLSGLPAGRRAILPYIGAVKME